MKPSRSGAGFTLIEVLVVIAIIGMLAALLFSAVASSREAARRAICSDRLRQIGLAISSHVSERGAYPDGRDRFGFSFAARLLPHLDQQATYSSINFQLTSTVAMLNTPNGTAALTSIETFFCPSDSNSNHKPAFINYCGNAGTGIQVDGHNGMFTLDMQPLSPQGVTDGTSTTIAVSEWIVGPGTEGRSDARRLVFPTPDSLNGPEQFDRFVGICRDLDTAQVRPHSYDKAREWLNGDFKYTLYNHVLNPNVHSCVNGTGLIQQGAWTASSEHPAGVNVLFGDAHVQFISGSIAGPVWRALGSRNGREPVSSGDF